MVCSSRNAHGSTCERYSNACCSTTAMERLDPATLQYVMRSMTTNDRCAKRPQLYAYTHTGSRPAWQHSQGLSQPVLQPCPGTACSRIPDHSKPHQQTMFLRQQRDHLEWSYTCQDLIERLNPLHGVTSSVSQPEPKHLIAAHLHSRWQSVCIPATVC